ncbi:YfhO family protein [Dysgonomonas sp. 25]|uniref:YfhO family protein n=1 Tax=Dysgonomonas sp. 25 TaxID=2302933 RepID=UPI0013D34D64|nr:YfhO family protein [Dysgonomonas sp. 25]NDV68233.1 hypothetical protein [Dysgonomonas sp. 25]
MINKIQRYLLENYPLLWNIRLFPVMLIIVVANVMFFLFGYWSTNTVFDSSYYYSFLDGDGIFLLYFSSIFIGVLVFVGWLVFYMRNNAFRIYYPRTTLQLYAEWLLIFVICAGISVIPFSMTKGCLTKWQAVTSVKEAQKALDIIEKVRILVPSDTYYYSYSSDSDKPIPIPKDMPLNLDTLDLDNYSIQYDSDGQFTVNGYNGASLLFYKKNHYSYYSSYNEEKDPEYVKQQKAIAEVKSWLANERKDSIYSLMKEYMALVKKHDVKVNLTADTWFDRIYNPPFYPVDVHTVINEDAPSEYYSSYYDDDYYRPSLSLSYLEGGYKKVVDSHEDTAVMEYILLTCLCFSLGFSVLVFSARVTTGKKWLKAFVILGIMVLLISLFTGVLALISIFSDSEVTGMLVFGFWLFLFIAILIYLINKIVSNSNRNHSNVAVNFFLWLMPAMIPLIFFLYILFTELNYGYYSRYDEYGNYVDRVRFEDYIDVMLWVNLIIMFLAMVPTCILIKKWKGLPDE